MTTPSIPKRPSRDEFTGVYEDDLDGLLAVIGDAQESLITAASGVVTPFFKESLFKHGVEKRIRTPMPTGFKCTAIQSVKSMGVTLGADGRPTTNTYALKVTSVDWRSLGRTQDNGEVVGVTIDYDLKHTEQQIEIVRTSNQTITTATETTVQFEGILTSNSPKRDVFEWNGSDAITIGSPGSYLVSVHAQWGTSATGSRFVAAVLNGTSIRIESSGAQGTAIIPTGHGFAKEFVLATGDIIRLRVRQDSGGDLFLNGSGDLITYNSSRVSMMISRIRNDSTPTGEVSLIFYGVQT